MWDFPSGPHGPHCDNLVSRELRVKTRRRRWNMLRWQFRCVEDWGSIRFVSSRSKPEIPVQSYKTKSVNWKPESRFARLKVQAIASRVFSGSGTRIATLPAWKARRRRACIRGLCKRLAEFSSDRRIRSYGAGAGLALTQVGYPSR